MNMAQAEHSGYGVQVTYNNVTEVSLSWAINEVLSNPKYQEKINLVANRLRDQPQSQLDKAMFWIEYVIRHDGAPFMQTKYLNFIQDSNCDVYALLAIAVFALIAIPIVLIKRLLKCLLPKRFKKLKTN